MKTAVVVPRLEAQSARKLLEKKGLWDKKRKLQKHNDNTVAIPIKTDDLSLLSRYLQRDEGSISIIQADLPPSKMQLIVTPARQLNQAVVELMEQCSASESRMCKMMEEIPRHWERHGDLVLLPSNAFVSQDWNELGKKLWTTVAKCTGAQRVARQAAVTANGYRTPQVTVLRGNSGVVQHVDNEIRYEYDITRCMFSAGNITEKLRIARLNCQGETVLDLYAGIGYFTLPYLVHASAAYVHACEWNPDAVAALKRNLRLNNVHHRCSVHQGDNRQLTLRGVADRVNLGLIPSSEEGWPVACRALKPSGGVLHIHGNVNTHTAACENLKVRGGTQAESGMPVSLAADDSGGNNCHGFYDEDEIGKGTQPDIETRDQPLQQPHSSLPLKLADSTEFLTDLSQCSLAEDENGNSKNIPGKFESDVKTGTSSCLSSQRQLSQVETDSFTNERIQAMETVKQTSKYECRTSMITKGVSEPQCSHRQLCQVENASFNPEQTQTSKTVEHASNHKRQTFMMGEGIPGPKSQTKSKTEAWRKWGESVCTSITSLLGSEHGGCWQTSVMHVEQVKSYAPHVHHIVVDVACTPFST
ncbi:tRNA wybutosine-synthesizing protein 2 homolog [Littorina saxatilis]|uniref:tRNA wybutosine-synthesizing protein 2 homolog n=1 Tax=Littorina saxatilis TaxID=31220 RepID=UPI0038B5666D